MKSSDKVGWYTPIKENMEAFRLVGISSAFISLKTKKNVMYCMIAPLDLHIQHGDGPSHFSRRRARK
ncbi:hypothetical protein GCM10007063_04490 [Lentibacillus kapialis]|uniref:Uncharacterized protein n=1 Tax=Lentibacillus kapialis TaxID=340214 RepID=A0A917UTZ2_9BACI|nr:hypothetical protein GCM10007063_04490 [Lentibacillus kapialis]